MTTFLQLAALTVICIAIGEIWFAHEKKKYSPFKNKVP